ncbi:hypothetical protein [Candidatus Nanosyncoccus nanoralicus]|uniref:Uncharacterized protein n=1 Tax=Candidatus Nanosyncoccus nanoralicus TaxID=2171996 RepID=A0ABY0FLA6_9BACT|nr:hypothetical protein [Candidatus Nanosyncoccus nanoralicus]RYC73331.1 hypothetical protein G3KMM_00452 [Candidatus Nanosyncoccus nanoralicus]
MDVSAQNNTKNATSNQSGPSSSTKAPRPDSLGFGIDPQQIPEKVAEKIQRGANILIALSKDPNLDEMSAAIALAIVLDQQKKHVTAIYSGKTPNALEFLKPEETFEKDTSSLQDFIIALNKSKADHLTYKLDGDYVKIYITPYKGQVKKEDLEYSYGDYNVDLVIVFNVNAGTEIDSALSEYGRIMHDASAINITSGLPGRFADLEWSDPEKSSVCEMVYDLLKELEITELSQEVATALLTGILSATERFSNNRTKPTTMAVASKLMEAGADQQLISANILKPETPATQENLATSDASAASETPISSDVPTTPETSTSSVIPITSEIPTSSDTSTTAGTPATVDTPTVSDSNPDTGLKELEELVNQNLAQTANLQNNQEVSSETSQLPNLPSEELSLSTTPLTTGNVMDELARMTASMTNTSQETDNLVVAPDSQTQATPQAQVAPEIQSISQTQVAPQAQPTPEIQVTPQAQPAPEIQATPQAQPFSQVQPEAQPQTYDNQQVSMQFQPQPQPQPQMQPQAQAQFETQVQSQPQPQPQPQPFPQFQPQQYTQPLPPEQPVSVPSMQSQLPPVNPLPFQSSPDIVGHTISDPVIESGEDMSRLMDEVLAEPSPIQNPVGYQSLINQGDYINQSLSQQPVPNPQPTPTHPLSVGQQPIVNYIPGQNIATLSAPAMPTMPQNTNYPNPEYTNTIPEYSTPAIPTMPTAPTPEPQPAPNLQPAPEPQSASSLQSSLTAQPPSNPQPVPTTLVDPMADFIQATPPATSTPIPDFLQPEAFLPPAPAPVVPAQPTPIQSSYSMQPTIPNMPLPPVAPQATPTPPIIEPTPEVTPTPQIPQAPTIQSAPAPTPQSSPAPQAPTTPVDPSAFRIPGTY